MKIKVFEEITRNTNICSNPATPTRVLAGIQGIVLVLLGLFLGHSAHAQTQNLTTILCTTCKASSDFSGAAVNRAKYTTGAGTYAVVSNAKAATAYIHVSQVYGVTPALYLPTFVNATGSQLAANTSEVSLQTYFSAYDTTLMTADRNTPQDPTTWLVGWLPPFPVSSDTDISNSVVTHGYSLVAVLNTGDTITLTWTDGTGIKAEFTVSWVGGIKSPATLQLHFNGNAWRNGKPIDRSGNSKSNSNSTGSGNGSLNGNGFSGGAWSWVLYTNPQCQWTTTVVWGSWTSSPVVSYGPC